MPLNRWILPGMLFAVLSLHGQELNSFSGRWEVHFNIFGKEGNQICVFSQQGVDLKGSCVDSGAGDAVAGKVEGKTVTWRGIARYDGTRYTAEFRGTEDPSGRVVGTVTVVDAGVDGEFVAVKQEQDKLING